MGEHRQELVLAPIRGLCLRSETTLVLESSRARRRLAVSSPFLTADVSGSDNELAPTDPVVDGSAMERNPLGDAIRPD